MINFDELSLIEKKKLIDYSTELSLAERIKFNAVRDKILAELDEAGYNYEVLADLVGAGHEGENTRQNQSDQALDGHERRQPFHNVLVHVVPSFSLTPCTAVWRRKPSKNQTLSLIFSMQISFPISSS